MPSRSRCAASDCSKPTCIAIWLGATGSRARSSIVQLAARQMRCSRMRGWSTWSPLTAATICPWRSVRHQGSSRGDTPAASEISITWATGSSAIHHRGCAYPRTCLLKSAFMLLQSRPTACASLGWGNRMDEGRFQVLTALSRADQAHRADPARLYPCPRIQRSWLDWPFCRSRQRRDEE